MIVNFLVIFFIIGLGLFFLENNNPDSLHIRKKYVKIVCFVLILQSGLRNVAVGDDTFAYKWSFEKANETDWDDIKYQYENYFIDEKVKDPGYVIFEKICHIITDDYQVYLFLVAIIFFTALGMFLFNNTNKLKYLILAFMIYMALFYWFFSITGIRQTLATAFTLIAFEILKKKKYLLFIIMVFLAANLHKTALVFLPMLIVYLTNRIKSIYTIILLLFPFFMIFRNSLALFVQNLFGYKEYEEIAESGTFSFTLLIIILAVFAFLNYKYLNRIGSYVKYYYFALAMVVILLPLSYINPSLLRIVLYYSVFIMVFIPLIFDSFSVYSKKISNDLFIFGAVIIFLLSMKTNISSPEYGFFWDDIRLPEHYFIEN